MKNFIFYTLLAIAVITGITACVKTEFDEPPVDCVPVDIQANTTIAQLRGMRHIGQPVDSIPEGVVISGEVVMDDRSGNYYKTLVIQDSTGGIEVTFNDGYLYTNYPIGRQVYIRAGGLLLTDYNGTIQIAGSEVQEGTELRQFGLTESQVRNRVVKGCIADVPKGPLTVKLNQISPNLLGSLIRIEDVEFIKADTGKTYADVATLNSLNRTIQDCSGNILVVRSSGYADFAGAKTPRGNGTIVGILSIYNTNSTIEKSDYQLYIRNIDDVQMDSLRCGEVTIPTTGLTSLNEPFTGVAANSEADLPGWYNIATQGSEKWEGRSFSGNNFVQASAFQANPSNVTTWLITPGLNLSTQKTLTFKTSWGFRVHDGLTAWYSTDFNGSNAATATWTQLPATIANASTPLDAPNSSYSQWVGSGDVTLPVVANGKVYIGFKYVGNSGSQTTTFRLDDVKVQ